MYNIHKSLISIAASAEFTRPAVSRLRVDTAVLWLEQSIQAPLVTTKRFFMIQSATVSLQAGVLQLGVLRAADHVSGRVLR